MFATPTFCSSPTAVGCRRAIGSGYPHRLESIGETVDIDGSAACCQRNPHLELLDSVNGGSADSSVPEGLRALRTAADTFAIAASG